MHGSVLKSRAINFGIYLANVERNSIFLTKRLHFCLSRCLVELDTSEKDS